MNLGYSKKVEMDISTSELKIREALKNQGFGIITEIDVKKTFKEKLDVDFLPYKILGACNPQIAHDALQVNFDIGLLLPCNVVVWENEDNSTTISAINAEKILSLANDNNLIEEAQKVNSLLQNAIESI